MNQTKAAKEQRIMKYSDHLAMIALWWKVIFLLPLWGVIPACIIGFIMTRMGDMMTEVGYLIVVFMGMAYFFEDILKRKLKISDGVLYFGYRRFQLSKLQAVTVGYEADRIIPKDMVFTFQDGYIMPFELSRIDAKDVQYIVKLIDSKYPHCNVDSTLRTLARCQELSPRTRSSLTLHVEVPYHAHRVLAESYQGFMSTLSSWSRSGPLVCWLMFTPFWLGFCWVAYVIFKGGATPQSLYDTLNRMATTILIAAGTLLQKCATGVADVASQPAVGVVAALVSIWLLVQLVRKLTQPNLLILDEAGIKFHQGFRWIRYQLSSIFWRDIATAHMGKVSVDAEPDQWKIVLKGKNGNTLTELEYSALEPRGRADLYDRLKHFAPGCLIAPDLAEALMPHQNNSYTELWLQSLTGSPKRDNLDPLEAGHQLNEGRYEVMMKLGVGGQGAAYLCRENSSVDRQHCQEVVLKETIFPIFVEDSVRRQALERFEHEARTLNLLCHDHIVKLSDYFVEDHRGYLVLEHIEGRNLRDHSKDNPMDEKEVTELALQMCDMLEYLHERHVIHRDFTPDNLILERSGTLKLIDFNVAQTQAGGMTGTVVGKHAYVPPEQFRGKPVNESDIYAMGCTLYYLLTGGDPQPITQSKAQEKRPDVSTALDTIIRKCTSLKAEQRYHDIATLRADLAKALREPQPEEAGAKLSLASETGVKVNISAESEKVIVAKVMEGAPQEQD